MKCKIKLAKIKSPKALSGVELKILKFSALYCNLKLTTNTNCPTQLIKPPKKALKGKFPTNNT